MNEIAGAGLVRQRRFVAQTREFLVSWQDLLSPKLLAGARLHPADYDELPRFGFDKEKFGEVAARVWLGVLALLAIAAALLGWSLSALRRYSPVQ